VSAVVVGTKRKLPPVLDSKIVVKATQGAIEKQKRLAYEGLVVSREEIQEWVWERVTYLAHGAEEWKSEAAERTVRAVGTMTEAVLQWVKKNRRAPEFVVLPEKLFDDLDTALCAGKCLEWTGSRKGLLKGSAQGSDTRWMGLKVVRGRIGSGAILVG
jgi:hypothetical protein